MEVLTLLIFIILMIISFKSKNRDISNPIIFFTLVYISFSLLTDGLTFDSDLYITPNTSVSFIIFNILYFVSIIWFFDYISRR